MDIQEIIKLPEGRRLEFKQNIPTDDKLERTVIAFSNSAGGDIYLGVSEKPRKVIGFKEGEIIKLEEKISSRLYENCVPLISFNIAFINFNNKYVIKITVYPGMQSPYYIRNTGFEKGTYIRVGSTNRLADYDIIRELERRRRNISFDSLPVYELNEKDLMLNSFVKAYKKFAKKTVNKAGLLKLGLLYKEENKYIPTNAAVLLSGLNLKNKFFPYAKIECARFKGTQTSETLDSLTVNSPVFEQPDEVMHFVQKNIRKGSTIGLVYREERWEYPLQALRELIINAVIHRDYSQLGRDIKVAVFDDMIEITSPGTLPLGIDIENLSSGQSEIRNRILAPIFKEIKLIEQWGTGFRKFFLAMEEYPELEFKILEPGLSFQVQVIKKDFQSAKGKAQAETKPVLDSTVSALSWHQVGTKSALSRQQVGIIIQSCKQPQPISELMKKFEWKDRTKFKKKFLNPLIELDLIAMTIPDKPNSSKQKYISAEKGNQFLVELDK